jgi:HlyD family secretion protein
MHTQGGVWFMKRTIFGAFLLAAFLSSVILGIWFNRGSKGRLENYKTVEIKRGSLKASVSSTGKLIPLNTVKVGSQVSGIIKEIYVDFNDLVENDQVVALIDPAVYAAHLEEARAQLLRAKAQLLEKTKDIAAAEAGIESAAAQAKAAQALLNEAELNFERIEGLAADGIVTKAQLDSALAKRDNAKGALETAQAKQMVSRAQLERTVAQEKGIKAIIAEREAALKLAGIKLDYCTIRSPIRGVVISREVDVGQTVAATLQSPVLFTIAEDLALMQVEADVSEADVGQIKQNQAVEFTVDAFPDKKFKARVRQVRNSPTTIQNVVTYNIIADVKNDSLLLRPGMTANVTILVANLEDILKVPNAALRFKPPGAIKKEKSLKRHAAKDSELYKKIVKGVNLDSEQSSELVKIIDTASTKLKAVYELPEGERDVEQAWRFFFKQVFSSLYRILREDQYASFQDFIDKFKRAAEKRKMDRGRPARLFVLDDDGQPVAVRIVAGITDESETQIVQGSVNEGDKVIVGLSSTADESKSSSKSFLSSIFGKR